MQQATKTLWFIFSSSDCVLLCFASWKEIHSYWFQFNLNRNKGLKRIDLTLFVYRIESRFYEPLHERFHEGV